MQNISAFRLMQRLQSLDWRFILKGAVLLPFGMGLARILGMAFPLVLAAVFAPEEYGLIQYGITLAMIISIGAQPLGQHVMSRFIGKYHQDRDKLPYLLTNLWLVLAAVLLLTLLIAVPALHALGKFNIGIIVILIGLTVFYAYWGISSGFLSMERLTAAYLGSNFIQLILVVALIYFLKIESPLLALMIYGMSYFLPLALLQIFWALPMGFNASLVHRDTIKEVLRFSGPIWISHASYMLYRAIPILFLEHYGGNTDVGLYSMARNLGIIFFFVPSNISTVLMPKTASSDFSEHRKMLMGMLGATLAINISLLVIYLFSVEWFVGKFFGTQYLIGLPVYLFQALGMAILGIHSVITAVLVGRGRANIESMSRLIALGATLLTAWLLIPAWGPLGAAITVLVGALAGLSSYAPIALRYWK